jgi:serine/threonine protein kinase
MPGLEGTSLGRYQLLGRLGRGGMSEVYLAYDERMNRNVALKVVSSSQSDYLERFHREAEAISSLHHDHILPAYDYGDQEPWHYLVMPNIEHGTLRHRLEKGALSLEDAGEMLNQIAGALQSAHDNGIIHRDIKPSNILLRDEHYAYLADFGLAKALEGGGELTQTGALLGTPEYMAPDLADGPATTSSDIYALGVLLYQMIAGRVPFTGETPVSVYMKHVREQPLPPSFFNSKIPHSVDQVVLRALEKDPRRRYQSPQELAKAFEQARLTPSIHETQEMPPYKTIQETMRQGTGDTPIPASRRFGRQARQARQARQNRNPSSQGRRLILPGNPIAIPTAASTSLRRRRITAPIVGNAVAVGQPTMAMQDLNTDPVTSPLPTGQTGRITQNTRSTHPTHMPRRKGNFLTFIIVTVGLLLLVVLPLGLAYYFSSTAIHKTSPVATPTSGATLQNTPNATAQQANATLTAATSGTPLVADSLTNNVAGRWTDDASHCLFVDGAYHVRVLQKNFLQQCTLAAPQVGNDTAQADVTLVSGHDAGMLLRVNGDRFYDFEITDQGQFFFRRHDAGGGENYTYLISSVSNSAVAPLGEKNTLAIIANGSKFNLFINGVAVGNIFDSHYASGQFAVANGTVASANTGEASFSNLELFAVS